MKFTSLAQIQAHVFIGNHASDHAAFNAIDAFAADPTNSIEDRAEALWIMGREGMGLDADTNLEHLSPDAMVDEFMINRE